MPLPDPAFAQVNYEDLTKDKATIINREEPKVQPAKLGPNETAADLIKNPAQPVIYTLRTDYKVQRGEKYYVDYQPYIASVGAAATADEQKKVKKTIDLPALAGYDEPQDNFTIDYDTVKNAADGKGQTGDKTNGIRYQANKDFRYKAKSNQIKIKHVFQDLEDFTKYTNPDGSVGETGELITTQQGNTGSTMEVSPLDKNDPRVKGFVPEADSITMQVPENATNFILEYRYNRAHYDVVFDTAGGTELPARTLYTGQVIPKIADADISTKVGGEFQGWKPSVDLKTKDGKTFKANEIIAVGTGGASKNLAADLIMPAEKLTFTAVWKDKDKAGYAVQFWAEKADHADGASLADKYDYIGTRVYKDQATGSRPDLDNEPVKDIAFPDLDKARLAKIWNGARFNRGKDLLLNKFYVYNQALTHEQNKDPKNVNLVKSVDATGKTVYNIYYDRQVYDLYFTKSNAQPKENTFYPEIWGYDEAKGEPVQLGGPGNPYHYKARFNQLMLGWPNDAMQTKGFSPKMQSFGWGPNYDEPNWPLHLDTPPYRLNADEFLDMTNYDKWKGYAKNIDKGDGTSIKLNWDDFKVLSFGIKQAKDSMPHHMDFWMDGFKPGETIIRYDLYRYKADTNSKSYAPRYPKVQGFTGKRANEKPEYLDESELATKNEERGEKTPFPAKTYTDMYGNEHTVGEMPFIKAFFNNADEFGDPLTDEEGEAIVPAFETNGYLKFEYKRNKYPLRFNYDPSKIKDDSEFNSSNQLQTFYEFPLKALSPEVDTEESYNTENPKNLLDNPEKLKELNLTDLIFTDPKDGKLKVKRPDNLSDQMVFKGWALDPAGTKLIRDNGSEKMPSHPVNLYAKWGEPDYQWKVTFDPNGGNLRNIKEENLTTERKTIQEGDIDQEETKTYPIKKANDGDKQVFTVIQRQKLVEPKKPTRKGYDFMGWEVIRYTKDATTGDYTDQIDTSYRDTYKVPELYSFGNDVVAPVYLKAIWVPNNRVDVKVEHYFLDKDFKLDTKISLNPDKDTLEDKRANYLVATTGDRQDEKYILATHEELEAHKDTSDVYGIYKEYNDRVKGDNTFFQQFKVEPEKIDDGNGNLIPNPKVENNVFKFFYKPFRTREYKVNYIDERFKDNPAKGEIIDQELVTNGNRHYDARNYRPIPGWKLVSDPQQQLFFDVNEDTNEFLGINGIGKKEITFYYKDVRVLEVPKDDPVPDGYVRVTFKADKGGSFGKDAEGKPITELNYDVIKGLKSDFLPVPKELAEGETADKDKHYITPETGKKFVKWDEKPLLNKNTLVENDKKDFYVFTAKFEWSGLSASGLVRTEAFKDPSGTWTNDFAPTIDQLKAQLVWKEKDQVKDLPAGTVIKLYDEAGNELTTDDQVYDLVNEKNQADKDELVRTVNIKAKVTFKDGKDPQELDIPIKVYKNVYEALTGTEKPLFLSKAEKGELKDITGEYVKVTVAPTGDMNAKDNKVYYVNKNAWVEIPEAKPDGSSTFVNWTADKDAQNENGTFVFGKRHKFTENTVISPSDAKDVVEQTDPNKKPNVPNSYVKVIVKTTDKATDATAFEKTFWVNPTKEVPIDVTNPTGKTVAADPAKVGAVGYTMKFSKWESTETTARVWTDKILGKFTAETTIVAKYTVTPEVIKPQVPTTDTVHTPQGKTPTVDEIKAKITPPDGKTISKVTIVENPDVNNPGKSTAKVIVEYTDGSSVGTTDNPVEIPVKVHEPIVKADPLGNKPEEAMENYVKVTFKAGTGGSVSGDLVYYVSPEVEVDMTESAKSVTKTPSIGYFVNGEKWTNKDKKALKGTFADPETEFVFNFDKYGDIVEKTDDPNQVIPKGYVKVTFKTEDENKGKIKGDVDVKEKIYYVNPKAEIKLVELADGQTATDKQLAVPKTAPAANYEFDQWVEEIDQNTSITSERIHVAKFKLAKVTLTYAAGEGTGTAPAELKVDHGTTVRLAGPGELKKDNATFAGWKIGETTYQAGDEVTLNENTTATAQWKPVEHKVTFNTKGGSNVASQTVEHNGHATNPEVPTLDGKVFMGWKEKGKEAEANYFDFGTPIEADKTLIAQWQDPVQKIDENATVEEQFIKVTFLKGDHGTLVPAKDQTADTVTYKVAKGYTFDDAAKHGLVVPGIAPAKYYKAKADNNGWDKELKLEGENATFTAQYEPEADVIPVDPKVTDSETIKKEMPEGMVLVEFVVDDEKAFMETTSKFYVAKNKEVTLKAPTVYNRTVQDRFEGWQDVSLNDGGFLVSTFTEDATILAKGLGLVEIKIYEPQAGSEYVFVEKESLVDGATGKLEIVRGNESYTVDAKEFTTEKQLGRRTIKQVRFGFRMPDEIGKLQSGDVIRHWSEKGNLKSKVTEITIK
ncbi:MAG: InlB B-repeat-containing protein [Clostridiales bacterium]|nr:InlB B-repeat-containing protein [Clostridiales bacterium]